MKISRSRLGINYRINNCATLLQNYAISRKLFPLHEIPLSFSNLKMHFSFPPKPQLTFMPTKRAREKGENKQKPPPGASPENKIKRTRFIHKSSKEQLAHRSLGKFLTWLARAFRTPRLRAALAPEVGTMCVCVCALLLVSSSHGSEKE